MPESPASTPRAPGFLSQALRIAAKDLAIEWRSREVIATMTFLAVVVVLIFSFAFVVEGTRPPSPVVAGILWIALVISGTVGLSRAFDREREGEAIRSLLLTPAPRAAIYLGKLAAERAAGRVVVLVTHDLAAAAVADQVVILRRGRVVFDETRVGGFGVEAVRAAYESKTREKARDKPLEATGV